MVGVILHCLTITHSLSEPTFCRRSLSSVHIEWVHHIEHSVDNDNDDDNDDDS